MKCAIKVGSGDLIYIQRFIKINTGVQGILRFSLSYLKGCIVGITDGRNLRSAKLKWAQVVRDTYYKDRLRHFSNITVITATV
jgi:hypothetical protein